MPTAVRSASIPASIASTKSATRQSDLNEFASIALFSGIGLLASLIAVLCGVQGAWF
jgi:hypothetical protein